MSKNEKKKPVLTLKEKRKLKKESSKVAVVKPRKRKAKFDWAPITLAPFFMPYQ